jgi:hypothetical protein
MTCWEPLVAFGTFALPVYKVLCYFVLVVFVHNFFNEEFLLLIDYYWLRGVLCMCREFGVVVFSERHEFEYVEDGESVWSVRQVKCNCKQSFVSGNYFVRPIKMQHELSHAF